MERAAVIEYAREDADAPINYIPEGETDATEVLMWLITRQSFFHFGFQFQSN